MRIERRRFLIQSAGIVSAQMVFMNLARAHVNPATNAVSSNDLRGEPFPVKYVSRSEVDPEYWKQLVFTESDEPAGTIIVDTQQKFLFLLLGRGRAIRYGIGVGRQGFTWSGTATIRLKRKWPTWTPPEEMIKRDPRTAKYANGMPGGPDNPLGARALYLFEEHKDTLYRLHGTNEVNSIGHAVSSGCIRLLNQDIIDLYRRVPLGTRVVVLPVGQNVASEPVPGAKREHAQWSAQVGAVPNTQHQTQDRTATDISSFFDQLFN